MADEQQSNRLIIGISGASGTIYGVRVLDLFDIDSSAVRRWQGVGPL